MKVLSTPSLATSIPIDTGKSDGTSLIKIKLSGMTVLIGDSESISAYSSCLASFSSPDKASLKSSKESSDRKGLSKVVHFISSNFS